MLEDIIAEAGTETLCRSWETSGCYRLGTGWLPVVSLLAARDSQLQEGCLVGMWVSEGPKALIISSEGGQPGNNGIDIVGWLLSSVMFLDD